MRGRRDGGKQKKGEMKSEEKAENKKRDKKGIVCREIATTGIVYTVTEKKPMHEGVGLVSGVMQTAASE